MFLKDLSIILEIPNIKKMHDLIYNVVNQFSYESKESKEFEKAIFIPEVLLCDSLIEALRLLKKIAINNQSYCHSDLVIMYSKNNPNLYTYDYQLSKDFLDINKLIKLIYLIIAIDYYTNINKHEQTHNQYRNHVYLVEYLEKIFKTIILDNFKLNYLLLNCIIHKLIINTLEQKLNTSYSNVYMIKLKKSLFDNLIEKFANKNILDILEFKQLNYFWNMLHKENNLIIKQYVELNLYNVEDIDRETNMTLKNSNQQLAKSGKSKTNIECSCADNLLLLFNKFTSNLFSAKVHDSEPKINDFTITGVVASLMNNSSDSSISSDSSSSNSSTCTNNSKVHTYNNICNNSSNSKERPYNKPSF